MTQPRRTPQHPGFVVLRRLDDERWELLGEVRRRPGTPARAARSQAIVEASNGTAKAGDVYAAVLRSEWSLALDWDPPQS
jgi:hypothetical protein